MDFDLIIAEQDQEAFLRKNMMRIGIKSYSAYRGNNIISRLLRRIWFKYNLPKKELWYNNKLIKNKHYNILLFDSLLTLDFIKWIRKNHPESRIVFFYSNIVRSSLNPELITEQLCEKWSFEKKDCKEYDLRYNSGYYFKHLKVTNKPLAYDVLFVGRDKGRYKDIVRIQGKLNEVSVLTNFRIVPDRKYKIFNKKQYRKEITYDQMLDMISKSKCILDLVQSGQTGTDLRVMESIFNEKKLITNNKAIENLEIYNEDNILIINCEKDISKVKAFLEKPYFNIDKRKIEYYDFNNWLSRFF